MLRDFGRPGLTEGYTYLLGTADLARSWSDGDAQLAVQVVLAGTSKTIRIRVCRYTTSVAGCR